MVLELVYCEIGGYVIGYMRGDKFVGFEWWMGKRYIIRQPKASA